MTQVVVIWTAGNKRFEIRDFKTSESLSKSGTFKNKENAKEGLLRILKKKNWKPQVEVYR